MPDSQLVMVSDLHQERLEKIQGLYPEVIGTQNYEDLLEGKVDAVVIATPVHTHFKLARQALLAGKHVLVEKPITASSDQAKVLIDIAAERGLVLRVGFSRGLQLQYGRSTPINGF